MSNYSKAVELLNSHIKNENLKKHCYGVEACMRQYAHELGEDEERWAITGLLHDLDWESHPEMHPNTLIVWLRDAGFDDEIITAILGHAYPDRTDVPRTTTMAHHLFACDELSGFIVAYALMKPGKLNDVDAKGVVKKLKDKRFAAGVNRDDIHTGIKEIGVDTETHITNVINALRNEKRLGLS